MERVSLLYFILVNNLNREKVEGLSVQAYNTETKQIQETLVDKNMEYRLRGLTPGQNYILKVKIPQKSAIEKALPASIPISLGKADATGVNFVVLVRPKKVDIRGYLNFADETDTCPEERVKNVHIELQKVNEEEEVEPEIKKLLLSCQFIFPKLEKAKYQIKIIEKQGKTYSKTLYDNLVDLTDEREVIDGVKTLSVKITKSKGRLQDQLNYSVFSPALICILLFLIFQWDLSLRFINKIIGIFSKENQTATYDKTYTVPYGKKKKH